MVFRSMLALIFGALLHAQTLTVVVPPDRSLKLSATDLAKMPRTMITVTEHNKERKFEGVLLRDLLKSAGAPLGDKLKGENTPAYVYLTAKDGYHASLALIEVEPLFQQNEILVADAVGGEPLSAEQGPFRLIVPEDKKPARWIRMLEKIEVRIPEEK